MSGANTEVEVKTEALTVCGKCGAKLMDDWGKPFCAKCGWRPLDRPPMRHVPLGEIH